MLSEHAVVPTKATEESAGFDMYSAENGAIPPHPHTRIHTDIVMAILPSHYGQIKSNCGYSLLTCKQEPFMLIIDERFVLSILKLAQPKCL